jgi:hypothetical protein
MATVETKSVTVPPKTPAISASASKLLSLHNRKMYGFEEEVKQLPSRLEALQTRVATWNNDKKKVEELSERLVKEELSIDQRAALTQQRVELFNKLRTEKEALQAEEKRITAIESRDDEMAYMTKAIPFLNACHKYRNDLQLIEQSPLISNATKPMLLAALDDLTREFMAEFFPKMAKQKLVRMDIDMADGSLCPRCKTGKIDMNICLGCDVSFESDYKQHDEITYEQMRSLTPQRQFTYRRINHFREFLRQIQGKSRASIPPQLIEKLRIEFQKSNVAVEAINPRRVRAKLKKLKEPKFYEHIESIAHALNRSYQPINIDSTLEEKLCFMFTQLEVPYEKVKKQVKKTRKNFMSYPYVFYKLCELLGRDEYQHASTLLKSVPLLVEQDKWWFLVTRELEWQFVGRTSDVIMKR